MLEEYYPTIPFDDAPPFVEESLVDAWLKGKDEEWVTPPPLIIPIVPPGGLLAAEIEEW